ncbi:hypothetical protein GGR94_004083 [Sulfitobacter geojensis]|nr:hypothetical protein [Sulfitobacter geojensis]
MISILTAAWMDWQTDPHVQDRSGTASLMPVVMT